MIRSGVSLAEAQKLARHSDINMTMRYTHIGMDDRAKAIQRLDCQCLGSSDGVTASPSVTFAGVSAFAEVAGSKSENPGWDQGYDALCHSESSEDTGKEKWRQ